jgi:hypothetical protein
MRKVSGSFVFKPSIRIFMKGHCIFCCPVMTVSVLMYVHFFE